MKILGFVLCFLGGFLIGDVSLGLPFFGLAVYITGFAILGFAEFEERKAKNDKV